MSIINTEKIFISLLGVAICGNQLSEDLKLNITKENIDELFELSKKHSMASVVGETLFENNLMPESETAEKFKYYMLASQMRFEKQNYIAEKISKIYEELGIKHILLKGAFLKNLYPKQEWRTSADIDILVDESDLEKAASVITDDIGIKNTFKGSHDWGFKSDDGIYVELHFKLIEDDNKEGINRHKWSAKALLNVWEHCHLADDKQYRYEMNYEYLYYYHIAHMAKHFENGGCGVKPFIDLWLINNKLTFDKGKLIKESGLYKFEQTVLNVVDYWFNNSQSDELVRNIENFVFNGGSYGNKENYVAVQQTKTGGKLKYAINRIFLPYDFLKVQFPILNKHKWLIPFCQVARWYKRIFIRKRLSNIINEYNITKNSTDNMVKIMEELGL